MAQCPLEHQPPGVPSLEEESARETLSRHAQLSVRGRHVFDRLRVLLPTHLSSRPTSRAPPFPPALLFSICDVLQPGRADGAAELYETSVLPAVLSKLRDWRLVDPQYRHSPGGLHRLALDLAGITDEAFTSDLHHTSHGARLRIKWVSSDSPSESQDREPSSSIPPSPSRSSVLDSPQECAHALLDLNEHRSDAVYGSCQAARLGTPGSEDASAVSVSRRRHAVSGFRSGCAACRHPRISGPSTPPRPRMASLEQRTPFTLSDVNQFDTRINTTISSPRHQKPSVQHATPKKTRREKHKPLQSIPRSAHVDENKPPLPTSQGISILFPRQRTHYSRISNALSSRDPSSPAGASVERRVEPSHLSNRTREGDKHTFSHRVTSVDLRLPMGNRHSPYPASPIDLHPHAPTRAQSFSYTAVHSHGLGSVAARVQKLSSNAVGSQSSKRLPSWSQTHLRHPTTTFVNPTGSLSPQPAMAGFQYPHPYTRLRPSSTSIPPRLPSDMNHRDRRSVSSQTHKHTQSAGSPPLSPSLSARKWQV